jgi:hypothetical protein
MDTDRHTPCAVWNADDGEWVVLDFPDGMILASTILKLAEKLGDSKPAFPMQVRYPGTVETVEHIH